MRFIHTGDIRLGCLPEADKPWSRERSREIRTTFSDIVRRAAEEKADLLLISGNLFAGQPTSAQLREVNALLGMVPSLRVVIASGPLDPVSRNSAALSFSFAPNISFLGSPDAEPVHIPELNTIIFGAGRNYEEAPIALPEELPEDTAEAVRIWLGCPTDLPGDEELPFSYAALCGQTRPEVLPSGRAAFCGSPEPLSREDTGPRGYYQGEIDEETGALLHLEFVPASSVSYIPLTFTVTPGTTSLTLEQEIDEAIRRNGTENLYMITVTGEHHPDEEFRYDGLRLRFRIVDIEDTSVPQYDFGALFSEHPGDMIGFYIRTMRHPDMSEVEKKALYRGIRALLLTAGERS